MYFVPIEFNYHTPQLCRSCFAYAPLAVPFMFIAAIIQVSMYVCMCVRSDNIIIVMCASTVVLNTMYGALQLHTLCF